MLNFSLSNRYTICLNWSMVSASNTTLPFRRWKKLSGITGDFPNASLLINSSLQAFQFSDLSFDCLQGYINCSCNLYYSFVDLFGIRVRSLFWRPTTWAYSISKFNVVDIYIRGIFRLRSVSNLVVPGPSNSLLVFSFLFFSIILVYGFND